jgi:hypothetical protein
MTQRVFGQDTPDDTSSGYQRNDTLDLTDILPSEVQLTRSGNELIVSVPSTGDSVTALWQFSSGGSSVYGINNIEFADGTVGRLPNAHESETFFAIKSSKPLFFTPCGFGG